MTSGAAFHMLYAYVLPALMLSNFLRLSRSDSVDVTIVCQGYGLAPDEKWWFDSQDTATANTAVTHLVQSSTFQAYLTEELVKKSNMSAYGCYTLAIHSVLYGTKGRTMM